MGYQDDTENAAETAAKLAAAQCCSDGNEIQCAGESCWDEESGMCEVISKLSCLLFEVQFPPCGDVGVGCCGIMLWGVGGAGAREGSARSDGYVQAPEAAPTQQGM